MTKEPNQSKIPPTKFTPLMWTILCCLIALILGFMAWKIYYTLTAPSTDIGAKSHHLKGKGIFMPQIGRLFSINSRVDATIRKILVKPGDLIKKDKQVAVLVNHDYELKLNKAKNNLASVQEEFQTLKDQIDKEKTAELKFFHAQLASSEFNMKQIEKRIKNIQTELLRKQKLLKAGLISPANVTEVENRLSSARIEKETTKSSIAEIRFNLIKGYRTEDLNNKQDELDRAVNEYEQLHMQEHYYTVHSPWDGEVLELQVSEGEIINRGQILMLLEKTSEEKSVQRVFAYFPLEQGKRINVGQSATIAVSTVNTKQYGVLHGKVIEVSKFAVSANSLNQMYFNKELVDYLTSKSAVIAAVIEPEREEGSGNYKWSKGKQPPVEITNGTVCTVTIDL